MGSDRRPGKHARSRLAGWTWPRSILTVVAVLANLALFGLLAYVVVMAGPHTDALGPGTVARCLDQAQSGGPFVDDPEVRFERPWVLRLEAGQDGAVLLCEYEPGGDEQPPRVVSVWEVDS